MTKVDHGFLLDKVRKELDSQEWEDEPHEPDTQIRRVWLGEVTALCPSGKFYTIFACGNLTPCPSCKGAERVTSRRYKRRTQKKHIARHARTQRAWARRWGALTGLYYGELTAHEARAKAWLERQPRPYRMAGFLPGHRCTACGGQGSREAYLDSLWNESVEKAIESIGAFASWEDGALFAVETRDKVEEENVDEPSTQETEQDTHEERA